MVQEVKRDCDTSSLDIAIVLSEFNEYVVENLLDGTISVLEETGVASDSITVYRVPGAFELPGTANQVLHRREPDGIVCLGAVIRGETPHFDYICSHVSSGIGNLSIVSDVPVIFGVLTTDTRNQALHRSGSSGNNKGKESANALLETIGLYNSIK